MRQVCLSSPPPSHRMGLYKLAADQGYAAAQYNLGRFYESGRGGLAKNDEKAARLFKFAADQRPQSSPCAHPCSRCRPLLPARNQGGRGAIAEAANTNKMTLYRHFASKDELVAEYLRQSANAADGCWE